MSTDKHYQTRDLVAAYLESEAWDDAGSEHASNHAQRYKALSASFGVVLAAQEGSLWRSTEEVACSHLLQSAARLHAATSTPFDRFLEAPENIADVYRRHGKGLQEMADRMREALLAVMVDVVSTTYPQLADRQVSSADLRRHGFDDRVSPPEANDDW